MIFTPKFHQKLGISHLLANDIAALFAGMGLGKTAMVLAALGKLIPDGGCKGALVIAPLRVSLFTWPDEATKWENFRWMKVVSLRTKAGMEAWERGEACIYTLNYESLFIPRTNPKTGELTDSGILRKILHGKRADSLPVDTVVWDELSKAKSPRSKRIQFFRNYRGKFKRHWGLTGMPVSNSYQDIFAQIRLLDDGELFGRVMGNFKTQYLEPVDYHERKWRVRKDAVGAIEAKLAKIALTLRSEDYLDIPPTRFEDVDVALPAKAMTIYRKLQKEMIVRLADAKILAVNKGVLVGKLQQFVGGAVYAHSLNAIFDCEATKVVTEIHDSKVKALRRLFDAEGRKPMIVAIQFKHERDRILKAFPEAVAFHSDRLADWNAGKIRMLVAHPRSMSHGLNMQSGGSRVCWFTLPHSPDDYEQLNARVVRTGQTSETTIFRLITPGTVDDAVLATLEGKIDDQDGFFARMVENMRTLASLS